MPFQVGHKINEGRHTQAGVKRIRSAFVRLYDSDPKQLDKLALATHRKALEGDVGAATFIRDTLGERPAPEPGGDDGSMREWLMWMLAPELAAMRAKHIEGDTRSVSPDANDINGLARAGEGGTAAAQPSLLEQAWGAPNPPGVESK